MNVLYFKDAWKDEPFVKDPEIDTFNLGDGTTVQTEFMEADEMTVGYNDLDDVEILSIPFNTDNYYFVVVAPKEGSGTI